MIQAVSCQVSDLHWLGPILEGHWFAHGERGIDEQYCGHVALISRPDLEGEEENRLSSSGNQKLEARSDRVRRDYGNMDEP